MDLGLRGKIALVTGASQGIGRAVAQGLAREGVDLALAARGEKALETLARALRDTHGTRAVSIASDLSRPGEIPSLVSAVRMEFGRVDILVTNAGGPPSGAFEEIDEDAWRKAADLTLMSVVRLCREVLPGMKERRWGRIVHLTSISVKQPIDRLVLSNSLRAAVAGLSKTLATEAGPFGVTVNCVAPGYTATERLADLARAAASARGISEDEVRASWVATTPAGRLAEPAEIADLVTFLASARAGYINGSVIAIDGGLSKGLL